MNRNSFYITTTLPYVNSEPHIGFAMELIRTDVIARYKKLMGYEVFFNTGTDEHGQKLFNSAEKEGKNVQDYVDFYAKKFKDLKTLLDISNDVHFIRTTDEHHIEAAQEFWKLCDKNGYIYKKTYQTKYCIGCELEKTNSELSNVGQCVLHPNNTIELRDEENYFFKFSAFAKPLLEFYAQNKDFVVPDFRFNEIKTFVEAGLIDFSISRLKSKMSWGVEVPGDDEHVMYVWFDALVSYVSTLAWPSIALTKEALADKSETLFEKFWVHGTPVQYCGKDNLRQQSAMWQAMLMAAGLPNSRHIVINGFITGIGGIKMSKSVGNVVNPVDIVNEYGADALRYFVLRELSSFEDSPFTMERFKEAYNANLANGIGNLTSRIMKMAETNLTAPVLVGIFVFDAEIVSEFEKFNLKSAVDFIWARISKLDETIQKEEPFKLVKTDLMKGQALIKSLVLELFHIAKLLEPFLPDTALKIQEAIKLNKIPAIPLFLRKD